MRRNLLQSQGVVFILFGILLVLAGDSLDGLYGWGLALIFDILALLMGIIGVALSLSRDRGGE